MPFKTYEELMDMTKKDPKMAMMFVNRAKSAGKQVVDEGNPGYGDNKKQENPRMSAMKRRMQKMTPSAPTEETQELVNKRKSVGY
jgi:hypothetical protein